MEYAQMIRKIKIKINFVRNLPITVALDAPIVIISNVMVNAQLLIHFVKLTMLKEETA
jgi:hypothetical protein